MTLPESENHDSDDETLKKFSKIWSLNKNLAAYRSKKIAFTYIPSQLLNIIVEKQNFLLIEKEEVQNQIDSLNRWFDDNLQTQRVSRFPSQYIQWQAQNQWPLQLKILKEKLRTIDHQLENLKSKRFNDSGLYELVQLLEEPLSEKLIIEARQERKLFSSVLSFYPVWIQGRKKIAASEEPWFSVNESFLPTKTRQALYNRQIPDSIKNYNRIAFASNEEGTKKSKLLYWQQASLLFSGTPRTGFLEENSGIVFTSPRDIAIEGFLDLACLHQTK